MEKFIIMPVYYMFACLAVYYLVRTYSKIFFYVRRKVKRLNSLKAV